MAGGMTYFAPWPNWKGELISGSTPIGADHISVAVRLADALIEIACEAYRDEVCCTYCVAAPDRPCRDDCPGLLARRALGVA